MTTRRILFVDDEPQVLEGLQNILRKQRRQWEMVFALGGEAALAELARAPFDVVVSDMRMPGMDGATLLRRVQEEYPNVSRIVLSGHAEREAVVRALPVANQFLSKPCDAEVLRAAIEQTCSVRALMQNDVLRAVVGRLDKLPSAPSCYLELAAVVARPEGSLADVTQVVAKDPAMAAKVLQLVNSSYFGLRQRITSVQRAVTYLGVDLIHGLALSEQVFSTVKNDSLGPALSLEKLQEHSLLVARLAKRFVGDPRAAEEVFAVALVHDIGKILLAIAFRQQYAEVVAEARRSRTLEHLAEREAFGVTHAEVGAYLLGVWGLPSSFVEAVACHHQPRLAAGDSGSELLAALHVADAFVLGAAGGAPPPPEPSAIDTGFLALAGLEQALPRWRSVAGRVLPGLADD